MLTKNQLEYIKTCALKNAKKIDDLINQGQVENKPLYHMHMLTFHRCNAAMMYTLSNAEYADLVDYLACNLKSDGLCSVFEPELTTEYNIKINTMMEK